MNIASVRKESEKNMVRRAVDVMSEVGLIFEKGRLEDDSSGDVGAGKYAPTQWVYRMEPALDDLTTFETLDEGKGVIGGVRYAVRQVLDQEYRKSILVREAASRQARYLSGGTANNLDLPRSEDAKAPTHERKSNTGQATGRLKAHVEVEERIFIEKRDFFGRIIGDGGGNSGGAGALEKGGNKKSKGHARNGSNAAGGSRDSNKVWVSFHEGFSDAVRRPVKVEDIMRGL